MGNEFYRPRIADKVLSEKLDAMDAVIIEGAKWCRKFFVTCQVDFSD